MKRKGIVLAVVACVLLGGYTAGIYAQPETEVTRTQLESPDTEENRKGIAENVLRDTGRSGTYDINDLEKVTVYYGDVAEGPQRDAVVTVSFGPRNTIVAAYTPEGEVYQYIGDIGNFYGVQNIQFIPIPSEGRDVVIVRETADQAIGTYEASSLLKGYLYTGQAAFRDVLHTTEQVEAIWNALWDTEAVQNEENWQKVAEATESSWRLEESPALEITRYQEYSRAENTADVLPADETFESETKRVIMERYYWSDEWGRFILGEATENATGEKVAVIENRDASPYFLAGFREDSFLIERLDGSREIVKDAGLEWLTAHP